MLRKKILALLLAAAMALSLLAGCGGGESAAQVLLKLLDGKYPNISVEIDPDLEADLRQAISAAEAENAGDDAAAIRAALETLLGSNITFRYLGDGQKGDTAFDLIFYAGSDPDKAAQAAYSQWNLVFSNVPADGQYGTSLAMVETNSGVWMLVKATVEKAGRTDKPDKDDDEPETQEPDPNIIKGNGFTYDIKENKATINKETGLQELFSNKEIKAESANIILETGQIITGTEPLAYTFNGTLQGGNGSKITLIGESRTQGLFNEIGTDGTVQDVDIQVTGNISNGDNVGAVAGKNYGTIQNCRVTGGTIKGGSGDGVGGIAGYNYKIIQDCSASVQVQYGTYTGGVVGWNDGGGTVTACYHAVGEVSGDIAGGVVGWNDGGSVTACYSTSTIPYAIDAGGVVGTNAGTVTACYHANGTVSGINNGGVVGRNDANGTVNDCYWSGQVDGGNGIGQDNTGKYSDESTSEYNKYFGSHDNKVDSDTDWTTALGVLNDPAINGTGYTFGGTNMDTPTLTKNP